MDKELFAELLESVQEGAAIMRGEVKPSRIFFIERDGELHLSEGENVKKKKEIK